MATQDEVAAEVNRRQVAKLAAEQDTAPLLRWGWIMLFIGWVAPIIPIMGWIAFWICCAIAVIIGVVTLVKGNTGGGLKLALVGWLASVVIGFLWVGIYATVFTGVGVNVLGR